MLNLLMYVATMHHLNNSGQESSNKFAVYDSDTPVTCELWQSVQKKKRKKKRLDWELLSTRTAGAERVNSVCKKDNPNFCFKWWNTSIISFEYPWK